MSSEQDYPARQVAGGIPVRNIWLLLLYASDLYRQLGPSSVDLEENPDEIPDLVAEMLAYQVEKRLRRNLTHGFEARSAVISRVRGHIDMRFTDSRQLFDRGLVACRFEELTADTMENQFVRGALERIARLVQRTELSHRCRVLAGAFIRRGVKATLASTRGIRLDEVGRRGSNDARMLAAAKLAFDLALPTETAGSRKLASPARDIHWLRKLFERAVGGFYSVALADTHWRVWTGKTHAWPIAWKTSGIDAIMPSMRTDVVLENQTAQRRIIIDTKFNAVLTRGWYKEKTLRSGYLYQIYSYLRSQEGQGDPLAEHARGMLLHPSVGEMLQESVVLQGHELTFATVDLADSATAIRGQLLRLIP